MHSGPILSPQKDRKGHPTALSQDALRQTCADPQCLCDLHLAHPLRGQLAGTSLDCWICARSPQGRPLGSRSGEAGSHSLLDDRTFERREHAQYSEHRRLPQSVMGPRGEFCLGNRGECSADAVEFVAHPYTIASRGRAKSTSGTRVTHSRRCAIQTRADSLGGARNKRNKNGLPVKFSCRTLRLD